MRKNPGILFFGGKYNLETQKLVKVVNKNFLMFPQDKNKSKQLSSKYDVRGCLFDLKIDPPEILRKKNPKEKTLEVELFNGDIE